MNTWARRLGLAIALLAGAVGNAGAQTSRAEVRKQVEASMLITGTIDIDEKGNVTTYRIEQANVLPKAMLDVVDRRVRGWSFEPVLVDGKAKPARSPMQMRLVTKQEGPNYLLRISGVTFGRVEGEESLVRGKLRPPRYPEAAAYGGVGGTVYLVLQVGRDGAVQDVVAEQVNLRVVGSASEMATYRDLLARAATGTARKWLFNFPAQGEDADEPFISVRVPVDFIAPNAREEKAGEWHAYVPGPRQPIPWRDWNADLQSPDAIASGGIYRDRPGDLRLVSGTDG
ncbi:protein tonB [Lysobacter arvi]|uniref:Protein tonB n=1 Tax=Lysobacter arvi TaxID=3038776 RepID=A0ABU1CH88_9GAMM|nr:protein tonB [Lysobacter arvi]MDR0184326.1 protein tonB [Lysobacter arvi]